MNNFKKEGFKGGFKKDFGNKFGNKFGGKFGGGRFDRDSRPVVMNEAVCTSCGKPCKVPFKPTNDKPVYCRDCYAGRAAMGGDRSDRRDPRASRFNGPRPAPFNALPQVASQNNAVNNAVNDEFKKQLSEMNTKIEKLISAVQSLTVGQVVTKVMENKGTKAPEKKVLKKEKVTKADK